MRRKTKWICYTILCMCLTISGCSGKSQETEKKDTSRSKKKVEVIKEKEPLEEENRTIYGKTGTGTSLEKRMYRRMVYRHDRRWIILFYSFGGAARAWNYG